MEKLSIAQAQTNPGVQVAQLAPAGNTGRAPAKAPPPMPRQMNMEEWPEKAEDRQIWSAGLNQWVKRPAYPLTTPREAVYSTTPGAQWFSLLDATNGYHQIMLDELSRDYTCFMTPWGRFRFKRAPQGCKLSGDK